MNISVPNSALRWAILSLSLIVLGAVSYSSGRSAYADYLENSSLPADWLRAAQLEPANADYWFKLGFSRQWDIENQDTRQAIEYFRRAVALDPRSARYWMELGAAYETTGQLPEARQAFQAALKNYPFSSDVHWSYGSFLLRQGELAQAYSELHRALAGDPRLMPLGVSRVWKASQDVNAILDLVLPNTQEARQQALIWFCSENEADPAIVVWKRMIAAGQPLPLPTAFPLVEMLLAGNRGDDARRAWREALIASGNPAGAQTGSSLNFNGGFEYDAAGGGLDWRLAPMEGVTYTYDPAVPHSGQRALRISFDGSQNFFFERVTQDVPVQPNTRYQFEGFIRTAGITTDSGIRLAISFPGTAQPPIYLDNLVGNHPWEKERTDFTTAADVHRVVILLSRTPSRKFDNLLAGTAWVDDVSLALAGAPPRKP
jgi:tetratricopeptide (TPR) repeat protein